MDAPEAFLELFRECNLDTPLSQQDFIRMLRKYPLHVIGEAWRARKTLPPSRARVIAVREL